MCRFFCLKRRNERTPLIKEHSRSSIQALQDEFFLLRKIHMWEDLLQKSHDSPDTLTQTGRWIAAVELHKDYKSLEQMYGIAFERKFDISGTISNIPR